MFHPIRRTRQFLSAHPIMTHTAVASAAFCVGVKVMSSAWEHTILDELGPEVLEKLTTFPTE